MRPSPRRVWLLATAALLLAFVAGGLSGAAWERTHPHERARDPGPRGPHHFAQVLKKRYALTDAQAQRVESIVEHRRPRVDSLMATVQPQLRAAYDSTSAEIRAVLTPQQRARFDQDRRRRAAERAAAQGTAPPAPPPAAP